MKKTQSKPPNEAEFLSETSKLAAQFNWATRSFQRENEVILIASTANDPIFDRFVWVFDTERVTLRCMLVTRDIVPQKKRSNIIELCARINEGLPFGCMEYSFHDNVIVIRDSTDLDWGPLEKLISGTSSRVLNLAKQYSKAIKETLEGQKPEIALNSVA